MQLLAVKPLGLQRSGALHDQHPVGPVERRIGGGQLVSENPRRRAWHTASLPHPSAGNRGHRLVRSAPWTGFLEFSSSVAGDDHDRSSSNTGPGPAALQRALVQNHLPISTHANREKRGRTPLATKPTGCARPEPRPGPGIPGHSQSVACAAAQSDRNDGPMLLLMVGALPLVPMRGHPSAGRSDCHQPSGDRVKAEVRSAES